jgi:DNA-binding transcriptional MerR regulator
MARYTLAQPARLSLDTIADRSGLHPELIRRFVGLSLIEASRDSAGRLWFPPGTLAKIARIQRLRAGLSLNYAAIGLVIDLLDRIDVLEAQVRRERSGRPWT